MIVTVAASDFVLSATEIAVTVTGFDAGTVAGAVKSPVALIVPVVAIPPVTPFTCQVTAVLDVFVTLAENCCVKPVVTVAVLGLTVTVMAGGAVTVTTAVPDFVAYACEVAVMVTVPPVGTVPGAVYKPDEFMVPMLAALAEELLTCQVTAVFVVPVTVAVNCWVWFVPILAVAGATCTEIVERTAPDCSAHAASISAMATSRNCRIKREPVTAGLYVFTKLHPTLAV